MRRLSLLLFAVVWVFAAACSPATPAEPQTPATAITPTREIRPVGAKCDEGAEKTPLIHSTN